MITIFNPEEQKWPIKVWLENEEQIGEDCLQQAKNLSNLPFLHQWVVLMPDTHSGYGMPIGGVIAAEKVIIPNAVGVDIGCGMSFVQTNIPVERLIEIETPNGKLAQAIAGDILRNIPTGFEHHKKKQQCESVARFLEGMTPEEKDTMPQELMKELDDAAYQVGTLIGNTIDFIVNDVELLRYFAISFATAISAAIGAFGWVTLVFAIMEKTAKQKILTEIQEDWSLADLPEKEKPQKPFSRVEVIIGIIFTVLFIILVNQYSQLLGFYYTLDGSIQEMIPLLNQEVFRSYLPYINGMLVLQLLFSASKLVFRKWTYPVATANLILNVLSFVLLWFILQDKAILNPELVTKIGEATDGQRVLNTAFNSIKAVFLFIFLLDSFEGFHDAYKNSKKPA